MSVIKSIAILTCVILMLAVTANAVPLEKRHQLSFRMGMWNQVTDARTETIGTSIITTVASSGLAGGLTYGYFLSEGLALNLSLGSKLAKVENDIATLGLSTETAYINEILIGARMYIPGTFGSTVRPYAKLMVGPYIGKQSETQFSWIVANEARTETVFGGLGAVGADFILGANVMTGITLGYNYMPDFKESIGGSYNYSGPEVTVEVSYLFGKIKE
jgi:hypothetical protein